MANFIIKNARVYVKEKRRNIDICINEGKFSETPINTNNYTEICASGLTLLPGIIDVHNDSIERLIVPMHDTFFLSDSTISEMIMRNFCNGITSFYFSLTLSDEPGIRSINSFNRIVQLISHIRDNYLLRDNVKIQLRYEISCDASHCIDQIDFSEIDSICFNDHSPNGIMGWSEEKFYRNTGYRKTLEPGEQARYIQKVKAGKKNILHTMHMVMERAKKEGIPVGIHDLSSPDQLMGFSIKDFDFIEFPINRHICQLSGAEGIPVILGAPNVLIGHSRNGNISVRDAIREHICDILCSDYLHSSLISAAYKLSNLGIASFSECWNCISLLPADCFALSNKGSISYEKDADFILVDENATQPKVVATFVKGICVYSNPEYI